MSDAAKIDQDMFFLRNLVVKFQDLSTSSVLLWWFPTEIQQVIESLFVQKPGDRDLYGILGLIMFAGIDGDESDLEMLEKVYGLKNTKNHSKLLCESQQNLSVLLFGTTVDNVREKWNGR